MDEIDRIRDEGDLKSQKLIDNYEKELYNDREKIDTLLNEQRSMTKNMNELYIAIKKNRMSRAEISSKTRELLVDKLKQIKDKKHVNDNIIAELTIKNEKMNIAIDKLKKDHKKKNSELKEIRSIKHTLIDEKEKIEKMRLNLALTENKLKNRTDNFIKREQNIRSLERDLKKKTIRKNDKIPISYSSDIKTKKKGKKKKKKKRKTKKGISSLFDLF